jgi:excisionase family DNA binding protein
LRVEPDDELTLGQIAEEHGLSSSTPRAWVVSKRLPAHRDPDHPRRWLVYRKDLDAFLAGATRPDFARSRSRTPIRSTSREDWSDAPEQATLDLTSSIELLPTARR